MCKIFTKEKIKSNLAQKLLSMAVSLSLMLAMVPNNGAFAEGEPTTFVTSAYANHWGRSDLRAYLNNVEKTNNTLPINSTNSGSNAANYPSQFSEAEYKLVQPFTYSTNVFDGSETATAVYETTDKFWLPSGNHDNDQIISWGSGDISANSQYSQTTTNDKDRIIPISYWSYGNPTVSWLRSPSCNSDYYALKAGRGYCVSSDNVNLNTAAAAACKIHLESVIFASAASAASIAAAGGAKKIDISGSSNFGKIVPDALPDYGMYLKTSSNDSFAANSLTLSGTNLTVNYSGGVADQYVVVHAFKEDSLTGGHTSYVAAKKLAAGGTSATIDVSAWGLSSLNGYTIKVWMEDNSGSLAKATMPVTFVGTEKKEDGASTNARVFAMKADLQTSWGKITNATDLVGANPTNQKIYFGAHDGSPLEFWIAGRETAANGGNISATGNIMTLYQAKSLDETKQFNASASNYNVSEKSAVTLQLQDNQSGTSYPEDKITFKQNNSSLETSGLSWQHRMPGTTAWNKGMPTNPGNYEIRCYAEGKENYERTYSAVVNFTVKGTPAATDFFFTPPTNSTYDGNQKTATVTSNEDGMGAITVKYYDSSGTQLSAVPTNAGTYTVKIDVAAGTLYAAATDLTDSNWKFTIFKKSITPKVTVNSKEYDGTTDAEVVSVEFDGLVAGETLEKDVDYTIDSATFDNVNAGENKTVTVTFTSLNNTIKANNYTLSKNSATATANIPKKSITPQITAEDKEYDGTTEANVSVTFDGLIDGETLEKDVDYTIDSATFYDANAGDGKTVTATIKLNGTTKANNYTLSTNSATATANITKKSITPQITAEDKEYDGTNNATVSVTFDDLVDGETLKKDVDYTIDSAIFEDKEVGTEKTVTATVSLKNNNYTFIDGDGNPTTEAEISGVTASITPKSITVTADNQTKIEGEADPELTYTVEGLVGEDSLIGSLERGPGDDVGTYEITQGTLTNVNNPNYNIEFTPGTFTIKVDKSGWGTPEEHGEIIHYVDAEGMTSVEISSENTDANGIVWLREESYDSNLGRNTATWYGLDNSSGIFQESSRFYVQWLNEQEHPEAFENIDEETRAEIENNNGWLFEVGVIAPDGVPYKQLEETIDFYVQIGDDWDSYDLEGFYITLGNDESVPVRYGTTTYPEGTDEFGIMTLSHFSPYFIYDKLTDEEKAAFDALSDKEKSQLDAAAKELAAQQEEKAAESNVISTDESAKTGDEITSFTISGLGLIMTLALGLMLNSKINKKKSD